MNADRLTTPIGEVIFTQRSVRKFRPDPLPVEDIRLILEAAVRAPNGANRQIGRFLVVNDREKIREFARLYHQAWWAKRRDERGWTRPEDIPPEETSYRSAMVLADEIKDVPCIIFAVASERMRLPRASVPSALMMYEPPDGGMRPTVASPLSFVVTVVVATTVSETVQVQ